MNLKMMKIGQREHPVVGHVESKQMGTIPLVDIPMISNHEWHRSCLNSRLKSPELYRALGEDVEAAIADLEEKLAKYNENGALLVMAEVG